MRNAFRSLPIAVLIVWIAFLATACYTPFGIYHTVRKGETLARISNTYNVSVATLKEVNYLLDEDVIHPGDQIFVPGAEFEKSVLVAAKSPPKKKSSSAGSGSGWLSKQNKDIKQRSLSGVPKGLVKFRWPVEGVVTSGFGLRNGKTHNGVDISAPKGTPIVAAAAGRVIYSDDRQRGYGNLVILEHEHRFFSVYAHNRENLVDVGERVRRGQVIARVGDTGRATGYHLHFEIRYGKKPVDPMEFLP